MPLSPPTRSIARPGNGSPPVPQFQSAEDYAAHMAALNSGPTGMYEKDTIQSGPHKGKTPDQVYAHYLGQAASQGLPSRSAGQPGATREQNIAAAKADGTYDAKMAAYNAAGAATGHTMDASGNIKREGSWVSGNQKGSQIFIPKIASSTAPGPDTAASSQPLAPATPPAAPQPAPPTFTRNLAAEEKSSSAGEFTSMPPGSRNLVAEEQQRQGPSLGQRLQTRIASGNLPTPTPPKLGPAAQALADFNAAPVAGTNLTGADIKTGAAGVAQQNANAGKVQATVAAAQNTLKTQRSATPPPTAPTPPPIATAPGTPGKAPSTPPLQPKMATVPGQGPRTVTPPRITPKVAANLPKRAEGGPVTAGQPYLVGEKGPEVVVPQTSGTVIPNHSLPKPDLTPQPTHMNAAKNFGMPAGTPSRPSRPLSSTRNWRMPTSPRTTATWKPQPPRLLAIN